MEGEIVQHGGLIQKTATRRRRLFILFGAEGETRTPTGLRPLDPEPSVSTNSTTSA